MYIGNSHRRLIFKILPTVYPYVYRELVMTVGTPDWRRRFIPMYIGNSTPAANGDFPEPVYPYVYRELKIIRYNELFVDGLSLCI